MNKKSKKRKFNNPNLILILSSELQARIIGGFDLEDYVLEDEKANP